MNWKFEEAQKKLPELINATANEPQLIFDQDKLVAAIVEPKLFQQFLTWRQQQQLSSLDNAFAELRQICLEEDYILEISTRSNRDSQQPATNP
jgi:hypothetical protein